MKRSLLYIGLIVLFQCCKTGSLDFVESFSAFPSEVNLTHQLITVKGLADPNDVLLLENAVIIQDDKSDFFFHVLNRDYIPAGSFVRKGDGPSEERIIQKLDKLTGNKFFYKTLSHIKIVDFNADSPNFAIYSSVPVIIDDLPGAFFLNGSIYGWNQQERDREFIAYYGPEKMLDFGAGFPMPGKKYTPREEVRLFSQKQVTVRSDGRVFAAAYLFLPILRIFEATDGNVLKEVRFENEKPFPHYLITGIEADRDHISLNYGCLRSSDKYIYAQYKGETLGESSHERNVQGSQLDDLSREIHVWDWDGKPVKRILLDKKLFNFDVSADDRILIGISKEDPDHLYEYILK